MNRDALNSVSPHQAAQVAFLAVDAIQELPGEVQVAGISLLFLMLSKRMGMSPREVSEAIEQAGRRLEDALRPDPNNKPGDIVRALREYLKEDL